jgi:Tol biopolymer transport system component
VAGREHTLLQFDDGSYIRDPAVSPDGRMIAFSRQLAAATTSGKIDYGSDLYVANREGGGERILIAHAQVGESYQSPVWLPNGKSLLYAALGQDSAGQADIRLEEVDLGSGERRRVIADAFAPALSPDGKTLAYISSAGTFERPMLYHLDTGESEQCAHYDRTLIFFFSLAWSSDGGRLAFAAADPGTIRSRETGAFPALRASTSHPFLQDIWVMNKDGSDLTRVMEVGEWQPSVAWSRGGPKLYVLAATGLWRLDVPNKSRERAGPGAAQGQILVLPPD